MASISETPYPYPYPYLPLLQVYALILEINHKEKKEKKKKDIFVTYIRASKSTGARERRSQKKITDGRKKK